MSKAHAEKFLDLLDKNEDLRNEVRNMTHLTELGKKHKLTFSSADLEGALASKWGAPEKRKGKADPFTCCCG